MDDKQRKLIGYCNSLKISWPGNARIAINFVLNYEEGAERNIEDGDDCSESYLVDFPLITSLSHQRHYSSESLFEYGSRVGVFRLLTLFSDFNIPITLFVSGLALERNPPLAHLLGESLHEIAGHGYRWINYREMPIEKEREDIQLTIAAIQKMTGKIPQGWYTGRRSEHTRQIIVEEGLIYDSESYNDDLPYWTMVGDKHHLIVPYTLDTNDARYATCPGFNTGLDFLNHLKATFDYLYREGKQYPKMMTVALHSRLSGRPGRAEALRLFIEYIFEHEAVWICRRQDIAAYWYQNHSYSLQER